MFVFFINGVFFDFWQNKPGDIFVDLTAKSMQWKEESVSMNFYENISKAPQHFRFDEEQKLIIQSLDGFVEGESEGVLVDRFTLEPIKYVSQGKKLIPC